jgi:DNA polymerase-3 subunit alpha
MTAEKLYSMEQARDMFARGISIDWFSTGPQPEFIQKLQDTLAPFCGGQCPIFIEYSTGTAKATVQLGEDWRVHPNDELLIRLRRLVSTDAVQVKYK